MPTVDTKVRSFTVSVPTEKLLMNPQGQAMNVAGSRPFPRSTNSKML